MLIKYILVFIFKNFFSMFALCCYPSLSIKMLIPANNWSCAALLHASLWHFLLQPSHMSEGCHKHLWSECVVLFKAFQQKSWNLCCRCAGHTALPMLTINDFLILCIFLSACLYPLKCSQVINLMDNQNCAVNSDYKGYRGEEIFCWVGQWYIWVTKDETLPFQDLFLKNKKRKLHSTSACQAALCLHEQWAVHQSLCSPGKWLTRGWQVQAQKILHEPKNNLSKGTL